MPNPSPKPPYARPWRVGRSIGRTIYDAHGRLIGVMDTPALARLATAAAPTPRLHLQPLGRIARLGTEWSLCIG